MAAHHACGAESASQGDASSPWEVADVLRLYIDAYRRHYAVSARQERVIQDLMTCRTEALGGHVEQCPNGGFERYAYHSCRNRHCPKCQTYAKVKWLQARQAELLPTPYFHTVFTLPHTLNGLIQSSPRELLSMLFQSVGRTLKQFGQTHLGGQIGATLVLHSWDQTLGSHVHLHGLIPAGALDATGDRWLPSSPHFLFPVHALSKVFRGKFVESLKQAQRQGRLNAAAVGAVPEGREAFEGLLERLYTKPWVVYSKASFARPEHVLDYLGRYTHRVAISNHRLIEVANGQVRFTWRNRRQGNRQEIMTLEALEWIRRFLWHVLPRGFVRIRHLGFLANRVKAQALTRCRQALGQTPQAPKPKSPSVAEWMLQVSGVDIERCPSCGHRPLQRLAIAPVAASQTRPTTPSILDSS